MAATFLNARPALKRWPVVALVALIAGCAGGDRSLDNADAATVVLTNGRIYTVNPAEDWAEALAVRAGKLIAVGTNAQAMALAGPQTRVIDLDGRMVMPGIHDTHIHPLDAGLQNNLECSFQTARLADALAVLEQCLEDLPEGAWLRGGQWNDGLFADTDQMPKAILDEIAPRNPVFLMDWSVHNAWVNSRALEAFGIDADTPDPDGGVIVRDSGTGEATGILLDNAAYNNRHALPPFALEDRATSMQWALDQVASHGVTTIKDAIVTTDLAEVYQTLNASGKLKLNVKTALTWKSAWAKTHDAEQALIDRRTEVAGGKVAVDFAKIMLDGIPPTYTAAMLDPYLPNEAFGDGWRGKLMIEPEQLNRDVTALDRKGLAVKIHATGDRSARTALDAFEAARKANGDSGLIHEVSHAELIHPEDVPRFAQLNVAAEMCPILWYPIPGLDWSAWLGPERKVWPVKNLVEADALVTYGSDWPVVPTPNPWLGIEAMVTRADPTGASPETLWGEQSVDLATTIRIFTHNGAIANQAGEHSGSLEVGKDADLIVLDRNIFDVPISDVGETEVLLSMIGGEILFDRR